MMLSEKELISEQRVKKNLCKVLEIKCIFREALRFWGILQCACENGRCVQGNAVGCDWSKGNGITKLRFKLSIRKISWKQNLFICEVISQGWLGFKISVYFSLSIISVFPNDVR